MNKKILIILLLAILGLTGGTVFAQAKNPDALQKLKQLAAKLKKESNAGTPQQATSPQQNTTASPTGQSPATRTNPSEAAFGQVVTRRLPLSPKQIGSLYKAFVTARKAASTPPGIPPRPVTSSIMVNLSPDSNDAPPVIRLSAGYISTLVFVDATGQPWPIQFYSIGDPAAFSIPSGTINIKDGDNSLIIQAKSYYKRSNLVVHLRGLDTPITLTLLTGQKAVDYRVDLRVPRLGPNAIFERGNLPSPANPQLLNVLNGIPPAPNARALTASGDSNSKAWLFNNKLFLRTPLNVISPGWLAKMTSIDGTHAYELQPASIILSLQRGRNALIKLFLPDLKD